MKNVLSRFAVFVSFLAVFLFAGCSNGLEGKNDSDFSAEYGTLVINQKSERAVQSEQIVTADVCVVGSDMETVFADFVSVSGGKGNYRIEDIPVGKNRVVIVQAKSGTSSDSKIEGICLSAVVDIEYGENNLSLINWDSSVKGNLYKALIDTGLSTATFTNGQETAVESAVPKGTHAALIDFSKIASDYKENPERTFNSSDYILKAGSVSVDAQNAAGYSIWLNDPTSSAEKVKVSADGTYSVENVAPGSWSLYIEDNSGKISKRSVTVESDKVYNVGKIGEQQTFTGYRVHFYGAKWSTYKIYYYNSTTQTVSTWDSMPSMSAESDGYYYDLKESWVTAGTTMVIFYGGSNSNRYPADQQDGVVIPAGVKESWFNFATKTFETSNPFSTEPAVSISPSGNASFSGANQSVTVTAKNCTYAK